MRVPHYQRSRRLGFNMTPMIDVVFLLIIFFLVSSHLAKQEALMPLPLPVADSGLEPQVDDSPRLIVNLLADGRILLAGHPADRTELESRLRRRLQTTGGELEVKIRSDRQVPYGNVEPILLACQRAGVWNVTFSVYRSRDID